MQINGVGPHLSMKYFNFKRVRKCIKTEYKETKRVVDIGFQCNTLDTVLLLLWNLERSLLKLVALVEVFKYHTV